MHVVIKVPVSHQLGKEGARQRLANALDTVQKRYGSKISLLEGHWTEDRLTFQAGALGQKASGTLDVGDENVLVTIRLPWFLGIFAEPARLLVEKEVGRLLAGT